MPTVEERKQQLQKLVKSINHTLHKINPNTNLPDKQIVGLLILQIPEGYDKGNESYITILGEVHQGCIIDLLQLSAFQDKTEAITSGN